MVLQEFDDSRDADDAVYELNGKDLLGDRWVSIFCCLDLIISGYCNYFFKLLVR